MSSNGHYGNYNGANTNQPPNQTGQHHSGYHAYGQTGAQHTRSGSAGTQLQAQYAGGYQQPQTQHQTAREQASWYANSRTVSDSTQRRPEQAQSSAVPSTSGSTWQQPTTYRATANSLSDYAYNQAASQASTVASTATSNQYRAAAASSQTLAQPSTYGYQQHNRPSSVNSVRSTHQQPQQAQKSGYAPPSTQLHSTRQPLAGSAQTNRVQARLNFRLPKVSKFFRKAAGSLTLQGS
jgi:hypothetical protein